MMHIVALVMCLVMLAQQAAVRFDKVEAGVAGSVVCSMMSRQVLQARLRCLHTADVSFGLPPQEPP